ncbi:MAG: permease [Nitrospiraceae bacterium]|nr:permease [Nitrospiraceae bacterium]
MDRRMYLKIKSEKSKSSDNCEVHGPTPRSVNKALVTLLSAAILLIIWHVWEFGPANGSANGAATSGQKMFPLLLGHEVWDIIFDRYGIIAQTWSILPYFLIGIVLAALIRTYKLAIKLRKAIGRHGFISIFIASLTGIMSPLCACGTLTTAFSLLFAGVPLAPVMALLVTSPIMSPTAFILTLNDLGPQWAAIRVVAAFLMGIFAGVVTYLLRNKGFSDSIFIEGAIVKGDFHDEDYPDARLKCTCSQKFGNRVAAKTGNKLLIFLAKSAEMLWPVGKYVLVGVFIGTIAERYMPYSWMYGLFGQGNKLGIVWITMGSIPIFLHQISVSSILYHVKSSLNGTMSGGAGLAFLIGGPVTAVPTMAMFWSACKKRVFFLYLAVCIVGTIAISYAFQSFVFVPYVDTDNPLLRGVKSLPGGESPVITRTDSNVRMVMDPGGKGIIAVSYDYLDGKGNMVFDSGPGRFRFEAGNPDNERYVENIADWLEAGSPGEDKDILVYDASAGGLGKDIGRYAAILAKKGFHIKITDRKETPRISGGLLERYGELWVFAGSHAPGGAFSADELSAISGFVGEGKGMLVVPAGTGTGAADLSAANAISSRFGVKFSGAVRNRRELPVSTSFYFLNRMAGLFRSVLEITHKA